MNTSLITNPQTPIWLLRIGLAGVLLYAGISSLVTPEDWIGYLPDLVTDMVDGDVFLTIFAIVQLFLAVWLLSGMYLHIAALVALAASTSILLSTLPLHAITFRDFMVVCASAALVSLAWPRTSKS